MPGAVTRRGARAAAVVVAAGQASRMGRAAGEPPNKVYRLLGDRPVLAHALSALAAHPRVGQLVVVVAAGERTLLETTVLPHLRPPVPLKICEGGATRQASVARGLAQVDPAWPLVLVHDGARPFVSAALIARVVEGAGRYGAAVPGLPVSDSLKRVVAGAVVEAVARAGLFAVQTPQGFLQPLLRTALAAAEAAGAACGDDAGAVQRFAGATPHLVPGDPGNFKLTTDADLRLARRLLDATAEPPGEAAGSPPWQVI